MTISGASQLLVPAIAFPPFAVALARLALGLRPGIRFLGSTPVEFTHRVSGAPWALRPPIQTAQRPAASAPHVWSHGA